MALPTLTPTSTTSATILPATGDPDAVAATLAFNVYGDSNTYLYSVNFLSGASEQVTYTYKKLGGDILDIELKVDNVYNCYEEAVLEYSYIMNIHQAKNSLSSLVGSATGSFDQDGQHTTALSASNINLRYPRYDLRYAQRVGDAVSETVNVGGTRTIYSASVTLTGGVQDYDLQSIISSSSNTDSAVEYYGKLTNKKAYIHKIYYKSPLAAWRFFGYYGGLSTVGNMSTYGQYADDSTFEVVPIWQNRLQGAAFEEAIYVRNSHYSYELKNNRLRLFPIPAVVGNSTVYPNKLWIQFSIPTSPYEDEDSTLDSGLQGVNNMGTAPFDPIPFASINAIGKQWIRRFALACTKEVLGQVRGKFTVVPIPGESVTLNWSELLAQAKEEKEALREELKTVLDELTYAKLAESDASVMENVGKTLEKVPNLIFTG